ncbi:MAG: outer membrane protein assembly factor BamA [Candidatus Aminicenantes bacterium]
MLIHKKRPQKFCFQAVFSAVLILLPLFLDGQEIIEQVEIEGNERIPRETILYYFGLRSGYPYDAKAIEEGFKALWYSGFFKDIKVTVDKGKRGHVIILSLDEYPLIRKFIFNTDNKIKERKILAKLQRKNIDLTPYSVYDPQKMHKISLTIEKMLADEGFNKGKVTVETVEKGRFEVDVLFHIKEGKRCRIGEIVFEGNPKLKKSILLEAFQNNQHHNLFSWLRGKDIFRKAKLDEDLENLKTKFHEYGYARAKIGNPVVKEYSRRTLFWGMRRMKKIIVPVDAGERYFVGNIEIKGNEFFASQQINQFIHLEKGDLYNGKIKSQAVKSIKEFYQNAGYFFAQVLSAEYLDSQDRRVDLTFDIREGDIIFLNRLKITGNTFTKDKVLRREMLMVEQEKFRLDLFSKSLTKLMRLGMVRIEENPEIRSVPEDHTKINVHLQVEELYRDEWQLTGGYNGYQGAFIGGSFSTVNFLGAGGKLDLVLEYGERSKNYVVGFFEPYLFDKPLSFRFRLFNRDIVYPGLFNRIGKGIQLGFDAKVGDYWWAGIGYDFEQVDVSSYGIEESENGTDQNISRFSAFLFKDTVDDPFFPSEGVRYLLSCGFAGSELGSDIQYVKPEFEGALFFPSFGNHVFGLHLEYRYIKPIRHSPVPRWERFYLGGERSVRGYDVYSIGPRDLEGRNIGGEKSLVFNIEYIMPVFRSVYAIFFLDTGNALSLSEKIDLTELYLSSGLEMRLRIPDIPIPIRLIFAYNNRLIEREDSHFAFRIALGASF